MSLFRNRKNAGYQRSFTLEQFNQVMSFADDAFMQKKWKAFIRKINTKTDDYSIVLKAIRNFLEHPFAAAIENKPFAGHWSAANSKRI